MRRKYGSVIDILKGKIAENESYLEDENYKKYYPKACELFSKDNKVLKKAIEILEKADKKVKR